MPPTTGCFRAVLATAVALAIPADGQPDDPNPASHFRSQLGQAGVTFAVQGYGFGFDNCRSAGALTSPVEALLCCSGVVDW